MFIFHMKKKFNEECYEERRYLVDEYDICRGSSGDVYYILKIGDWHQITIVRPYWDEFNVTIVE